MKTALVTHAWLDNPQPGYRAEDGRCRRVERWLDHYEPWGLYPIILNNGPIDTSPCPTRAVSVACWPHFETNTFRWNYPHVWRNYWYIKDLLANYDRVFFIATDAYVLSDRLADYLFSLESGWTALWCRAYRMPEPQIQVITKCPEFMEFFKGECAPMRYNGACEEITLPFTWVETGFVGDRYGDMVPPPPYQKSMDYYAQVPDDMDWDDSQFPKLTGRTTCVS